MKIEFSHVDKYFGKVRALADVNVTLPDRAKVALIGPNGSGKTTLMRALLGLVNFEGELRVDDKPVNRAEFARQLAYVPQIAPQISASCGEVVKTVCTLRRLEVASVVQLAARLDLPFAAIADRPFRSLSGGSKQKLLIALALAAKPDLLILDEPTANLDADARGKFFALQREYASHATLVLCSHRLEEIRSLVTHVVALTEGKLTYNGAAATYLADRVGSMLELFVDGTSPWLQAAGFVAGANGWWSKSVDRDAKMTLLPLAVDKLGAQLRDVMVRDVDLIELQTTYIGTPGGTAGGTPGGTPDGTTDGHPGDTHAEI